MWHRPRRRKHPPVAHPVITSSLFVIGGSGAVTYATELENKARKTIGSATRTMGSSAILIAIERGLGSDRISLPVPSTRRFNRAAAAY